MEATKKLWIQDPVSDIVFYSFGWIAVFLALLVFSNNWALIILIVLLFNYVHRHYTFALVYGEQNEFNKHKRTYILLPLAATAVTAVTVLTDIFYLLLAASVLWTMYHTIAQKYGITRIYSRKAGYGNGPIDKGMIYSWFAFIFFFSAYTGRNSLTRYEVGRVFLNYLEPYMQTIYYLIAASLIVALYFTIRYFYIEYLNRNRLSIPKNIYVLSILILFLTFLYSLEIGYIVFGFSHALEYIAFVNFFVAAKYKKEDAPKNSLLSKASKKLWFYSALFSIAIVGLCLLGRGFNKEAFVIYIIGSSFLHFIYDGMIWKVRRPEVGKPFEIKYPATS